MVGRTPEYLGKEIEPREMTIATIIILIPIFLILIFSAVAVLVDLANRSPQSGPRRLLGNPVCIYLCIPE